MNTLLEFIKKYYYWFLFIILEAISLVIMFQGNNYHGSVWFTSANTVAGKVNGCYADVIAFIHLKDVNKSLTSENIYLQKQNSMGEYKKLESAVLDRIQAVLECRWNALSRDLDEI